MSRTLLVLVSVFALAACGGGGDGAPAAEAATAPASLTGGTATSSVPAAALGTTTAQASTATRAPDATNVAAPSATAPAAAPATTPTASTALCGPNPGGAMFACDPRWPYPGLTPANGATQAEVDGYNANCQTARCLLVRCDDARVLPGHMATACLFRPVVPTAALRRTDGAPTTRA